MRTIALALSVLISAGVGCALHDGSGNGDAKDAPVTGDSSGDGGGATLVPTYDVPNDAGGPVSFDFDAIAPADPDAASNTSSDAGTGDETGPVSAPKGRVVYGLDESSRILRFGTQSADSVSVHAVTGLTNGESLIGIDFRPANGALYALSDATQLYTIDLTTYAVKAVGAPSAVRVMGQAHGFDFNPVADRARVHTDIDENLRIDPTTGAATADATLMFGASDVNFDQSPNLVATAYTNSVAPAPSSTVLYAIDSTRNLLTMLANPNDGNVTTIGALGVDVDQAAGFDIWGKDPNAEAYAALTVAGVTGLYSIDLKTAAAKLIAPIAHTTALVGIAIQP